MALATGTGLLLLSVLTAVFSRVLAGEFSSWNPWIVRRIIKLAVSWLPEEDRKRYTEEWQSYANEVPGEIGKILSAMGFLLAACKMVLNSWDNQAGLLDLAANDVFCSSLPAALETLRHMHLLASKPMESPQW